MYQGAIDNLLGALRQAIKLVEDNPDARDWKKSITELRRMERLRIALGRLLLQLRSSNPNGRDH
jgi:hypothetical protein